MGLDLPQGSGWRTGGPSVGPADVNASLTLSRRHHSRRGHLAAGPHRPPHQRHRRRLRGRKTRQDTRGVAAIERDLARARRPLDRVRGRDPLLGRQRETSRAGWGRTVDRSVLGERDRELSPHVRRTHRVAAARRDPLVLPRLVRVHGEQLGRSCSTSSSSGAATTSRTSFPRWLATADTDRVSRVQSDYRQTLDEMLLEHFVQRLTSWSHSRGSLMREQAHGSPGNLLDLYAASDIPETEIFGVLGSPDADPLINMFASSAAHVAGRPLASAESFTWLGRAFLRYARRSQAGRRQDVPRGDQPPHLPRHGVLASAGAVARLAVLRLDGVQPAQCLLARRARVQSVHRARAVADAGRPAPTTTSSSTGRSGTTGTTLLDAAWISACTSRSGSTTSRSGRSRARCTSRASVWTTSPIVSSPHRCRPHRVECGRAAESIPRSSCRTRCACRPRRSPGCSRSRASGATVLFVGPLPTDVPGLARLAERRAELTAAQRPLAFASRGQGVREARIGGGRVLRWRSPGERARRGERSARSARDAAERPVHQAPLGTGTAATSSSRPTP